MGEATTIPPGHGTSFRALYELGQREHSLQIVVAGAVRGTDLGIPGDEPLEVEITPTYRDGVSPTPRTGPTAKARLTWSRDGLRLPLLYRTQVLDPDGPAI